MHRRFSRAFAPALAGLLAALLVIGMPQPALAAVDHAPAPAARAAGMLAAPTASTASTASTATLAGTVTFPAGVDLMWGSTSVRVYPTTGWTLVPAAQTTVAKDGTFRLPGLAPGTYRVSITSWGRTLIDEWWRDKPDWGSSTPVKLAAGKTTVIRPSLDARPVVDTSASISGTLRLPAGTSTSTGYGMVHASPVSGDSYGSADVDASGRYTITGLAAGAYTLYFEGPWPSGLHEYWKDAEYFEDATRVTLRTGEARTGIDATLEKKASIAGAVTFPKGTTRTSGDTHVQIHRTGQSGYSQAPVATNGTFRIGGLQPGSYKVRVVSRIPGVSSVWLGGRSDAASSTTISLKAGQSKTGVKVALGADATISGRVSVPAGTAVTGDVARITVYAAKDMSFVTTVNAGRDGVYRVAGLPAGTYKLHAEPLVDGLSPQWWGGAAEATASRAVTVATNQNRTGTAFALAGGARLSGKVTGSHVALGRSIVQVYRLTAAGTWKIEQEAATPIAKNGTYSVTGLRPGTYTLSFTELTSAGKTTRVEWWQDKPDQKSATRIVVTAGQHRTGLNVDMRSIAVPALTGATPTITGTVAVGSRLTANVGAWTKGTALSYQWYADGVAVSGATGKVFAVTSAHRDKAITVKVTGKKAGYQTLTRTSAATLKALTAPVPTVTGTAVVGSTLTAKTGAWTSRTVLSYQWYAAGTAIPGATKATLQLTAAQRDKTITVTVTGKKNGYASTKKTSAATSRVLIAATPTITGTANAGSRLTAKPGTWSRGTALTYQWYAGGAPIPGATNAILLVTPAQRGKTITVTVTGKKSGYPTVAKTSKPTVKIP